MYHPIHTFNNADDFFLQITEICLFGSLDVLGKQLVLSPYNIEIWFLKRLSFSYGFFFQNALEGIKILAK